jgi:hypothetical protein
LLALVVSAGCTRDSATHALQTEGVSRIATANSTLQELNEKFAINLNPLNEIQSASERARGFDWSKLNEEQRRQSMEKLLAHVKNVERIVEISRQPGMRLLGNEDSLKKSSDAAWLFYRSGEKFLSKAKTHSPVDAPLPVSQ